MLRQSERRTPVQARSRVTVDAILEAAARILVDEGVEAASTNRVAKVAGVSVGTLYQYFGSKQAILTALARRHADEMTGMISVHAGALLEAPPAVAVPAYVEAMVDAHRLAPRLHVALVEVMLTEKLVLELQDPGRRLVRAWLEVHREVIRPTDLDAAAFLLTTTVESAIHAQILEDPARLSAPSWRAELDELLLRYLVP